MTDISEHEAYSQLQEILHLPPLPALAARLLQEITQPETDIDSLSSLIEQDPGLAARIVGIANSAYFARIREVSNVHDAIVRVLGLNIVRGLAIGIALSKPFTMDACPTFDLERYWYRAFMGATLAVQLGKHTSLTQEQQDCCFLAGLLNNIGLLVLVNAFPGRMHELFSLLQAHPDQSLRSLQRQTLAVDEIGAGKLICRNWHLPHCVCDVIRYTELKESSGVSRPMVEWILYCCQLAETLYDNPETEPPAVENAGPAAAGLSQERLTTLLAEVLKLDEQVRALASGLMQGE